MQRCARRCPTWTTHGRGVRSPEAVVSISRRAALAASHLLAFVTNKPVDTLEIQLQAPVERVGVVVGFCWTDADGNVHTKATDAP